MEGSTAQIGQGYTQPVLRWAGSKKSVLTKLEDHLPDDYSRYVELFAGSACLFFKILPESAIISDSNRELTNFYRVFSKNFSEVYEQFFSIPRTSEEYYKIREEFKYESDRIRRAALFLYLNRNCFNGIYRTNLNGHFNVPFSSSRVAGYPTEEALKSAALSLKTAKVVCGDFEQVCRKNIKEGDFIYMDPPYYVPNKRVFKEYSGKPFSEEDFYRLSDLLDFIDQSGAKFMLSYPDCTLSRGVAKRWNSSRMLVRRIIGGTKKSRTNKYELVVKNY